MRIHWSVESNLYAIIYSTLFLSAELDAFYELKNKFFCSIIKYARKILLFKKSKKISESHTDQINSEGFYFF